MTEVTVKPGSKRAICMKIMNDNLDKPMAEVVAIMVKTLAPWSEAAAKSMYKWQIENGLAGGKVEKAARKVVEKAAKKEKAPKKEKAQKVEVKAKAPEKTPEEIEAIKAKNLARLKEVGKKYRQTASNKNHPGVEDFDESKAKDEVTEMYNDLDSFKAPEFLTPDQVKALV